MELDDRSGQDLDFCTHRVLSRQLFLVVGLAETGIMGLASMIVSYPNGKAAKYGKYR